MKILLKYYYHPFFLYILQAIVLIIGVLFFVGCPTDASDEKVKVAFQNYTGKWSLTSSFNLEDSSLIKVAKLNLQSDSIFTCTASFFMKKDSLKYQPLQGSWSIIYRGTSKYDSRPDGEMIVLKVDSTTKVWKVTGGGTKDSIMVWESDLVYQTQYQWHLN